MLGRGGGGGGGSFFVVFFLCLLLSLNIDKQVLIKDNHCYGILIPDHIIKNCVQADITAIHRNLSYKQ